MTTLLILIPGLINFVPIIGLAGQRRLESLYQTCFQDPTTRLLMQHRALLFGLIGGFMIYAAFLPSLWTTAIVMGLASMLGFLILARREAVANPAIRKIALADILGSVLLVAARLTY